MQLMKGTKVVKAHKIFILVHSLSRATSSSFATLAKFPLITQHYKQNQVQEPILNPTRLSKNPYAEHYYTVCRTLLQIQYENTIQTKIKSQTHLKTI